MKLQAVRRTAVLRGYILLILMLVTAGLWAQIPQEEIFRHPPEPKTMDALKTTCSRLAGHPVIPGNFEQKKILSRHNRSLKSSGNSVLDYVAPNVFYSNKVA